VTATTGKTRSELTELAEAALRSQPGCETASVPAVRALANVRAGRNWEIPNVVLGDSLISDVDRAVMSVHRRLGRKYHLLPGE
jgi:hypothetical protein